MRLYALALCAACLACEQKSTSQSPAPSASGPDRHALVVKYQICDADGRNCFVSAAFDDMRACERYRLANSYCDAASAPGILVCNEAAPPRCSTQLVPGSITCPLSGEPRLARTFSSSKCVNNE
jgi:hypothetical protein